MNKSLILNEIKLAYSLATDRDFAHFLGIAPTTLSSWHKRNTMDYDLVYAKCVDLNAEFMLTGTGTVKKNTDLQATTENEFTLRTDRRTKLQRVPLYEMEAAASLVQLFEGHQNIIDYIAIPNLPKSDGALYITGDSMYPLLKSGDIAIYKRINNHAENILYGNMYILSVRMDDDVTTMVKYVQKSEMGVDWIKLVSQNTHHAPKDFHLNQVLAMAIIKASIRINSMM